MQSKNSKKDQFDTLYKNHGDKIYRLCYGYLFDKGEIEDLFQQVLLNIWENLESFRGEAQLSTWVYRLTVNTAITYSKKQQQFEKVLRYKADITLPAHEESQNNEDDRLPAFRDLHECIQKLEKQDRIIISLYLEDLSYDEISEVVGISANYAGVKINRIKKKLQQLMNEL